MSSPFSVFIAYAFEDSPFIPKLEKHLRMLERENLIRQWHSGKTLPGGDWEIDVRYHLDNADIILLLISADFIASDVCYDEHMQNAIWRHCEGKSKVVPILLRHCDFKGALFCGLKPLPETWIKSLDEDYALMAVSKGIRKILESIEKEKRQREEAFQETIDAFKDAIEFVCRSEDEKRRRRHNKERQQQIYLALTAGLLFVLSLSSIVQNGLQKADTRNIPQQGAPSHNNKNITSNSSSPPNPPRSNTLTQESVSKGWGSPSQPLTENRDNTTTPSTTSKISTQDPVSTGWGSPSQPLTENRDRCKSTDPNMPRLSGLPSPRPIEPWLQECRIEPLRIENVNFSERVTLDFRNGGGERNIGDLVYGTLKSRQIGGPLEMDCQWGQKISFALTKAMPNEIEILGIVLYDPSGNKVDLEHDSENQNLPGQDINMGAFLSQGEIVYGRSANANGHLTQGTYTVDIENRSQSDLEVTLAVICGG